MRIVPLYLPISKVLILKLKGFFIWSIEQDFCRNTVFIILFEISELFDINLLGNYVLSKFGDV